MVLIVKAIMILQWSEWVFPQWLCLSRHILQVVFVFLSYGLLQQDVSLQMPPLLCLSFLSLYWKIIALMSENHKTEALEALPSFIWKDLY